jgi:hypothetical protein
MTTYSHIVTLGSLSAPVKASQVDVIVLQRRHGRTYMRVRELTLHCEQSGGTHGAEAAPICRGKAARELICSTGSITHSIAGIANPPSGLAILGGQLSRGDCW